MERDGTTWNGMEPRGSPIPDLLQSIKISCNVSGMGKNNITDKKWRKNVVEYMTYGCLPEACASEMGISIQEFDRIRTANKKNKLAYELAYTNLMAFYQAKLIKYMDIGPSNKEAMKLFFSYFLDVIEKKPTQHLSIDDQQTHEAALKELAE